MDEASSSLGVQLTIDPIAKGSTQVVVKGPSDASLAPGDDVLLFSGQFGGASACRPTDGSVGSCHFTELNTIASGSGNTYTLAYPTSKNYGPDVLNSTFGMVTMPTTPHNVSLYHMAINTYDPITATGQVFGLTVDAVNVNGYINHGAFYGGSKRDVTIKNSSWGLGRGESGYSAEEEYDKFTNLQIFNSLVDGYSPVGAAGPSQQARLFATEGTSQITLANTNSFNDVSFYIDETADVVVDHNFFNNGIIKLGTAFGPNKNPWGSTDSYNSPHVSFLAQTYNIPCTPAVATNSECSTAAITNNTFTISSGYSVPWVIRLGNFDIATVSGNAVNYSDNPNIQDIIIAQSGSVIGNTITLASSPVYSPIAVLPDAYVQANGSLGGPASFNGPIQNNIVNGPNIQSVVHIPDPGFVDPNPICVSGNVPNTPPLVDAANHVTLRCP